MEFMDLSARGVPDGYRRGRIARCDDDARAILPKRVNVARREASRPPAKPRPAGFRSMAQRLLYMLRPQHACNATTHCKTCQWIENNGQATTTGNITMKIRSAEFLAAVAIITSAAVMQIREQVQVREAPSANAQATSPSCGVMHDGLVPAACEPTRDERQVERAPQPQRNAPQVWV
jgi:hypothetical protein